MRLTHLIDHRRIGAVATAAVVLALSVTACGSGEEKDSSPASAKASAAGGSSDTLLAKIPSLGESYPAGVARFVDTDEGKDYGLAVTVAGDGAVVAYLCDGKSLGRAFSGQIQDGTSNTRLKAVSGAGTIELQLSGGAPSSASVDAGAVTDEFSLASTDRGGYFRKQVKDSTLGWVVSDNLELKGVTAKAGKTVAAIQTPALTPEEQQLVPVEEDASAPPESFGFIKDRRCSRLRNQYQVASDAFESGPSSGLDQAANNANLALAKGKSLGCGFATDPNLHNGGFFTV